MLKGHVKQQIKCTGCLKNCYNQGNSTLLLRRLYLSQYQLGTSLRATPGISSKNLPGGSGFDFYKLCRGREFDKGRDFVKNESETLKNCVDQIFTGEKNE